MVRIPTSGCLTVGDCTHSASVLELQKSLGEKEWLAALGFALMLERGSSCPAVTGAARVPSSSSSSKWAPYVAVLPASEPNVVMMWTDEQRRYLAGTEVEQALRDERAQARMEWDGHIKTIVGKLEGVEKGAFTFDKYLAARSVVSSRAFTINPLVGVGLVPIADLFNHRTGGHHVHLTDLEDKDKVVIPEEVVRGREGDCMFVKVVKAVNEGEEVFNTYGELGNAKLLCSYGFAQINNPADHITVSIPALRAAAALRGISGAQIAARLAWCETNGVCNDETTFQLRAHSVPSETLLLVLWILATTDERFHAMRKATKQNDKGTSTSAEIVAHFTLFAENQGGLKEESALKILSETLRRRRALYKTAPEDGGSDWKSHISILLNSEEEIICSCEKYSEDNVKREDAGENKKRKVDCGKPDEGGQSATDAFSLFD